MGVVFHFSDLHEKIVFRKHTYAKKRRIKNHLILRSVDVSDVSYAGIIRIRYEGTGASLSSVSAGRDPAPRI